MKHDPKNPRRLKIELDDKDALLLVGSLMHDVGRFEDAGNDLMVSTLRRVIQACYAADEAASAKP